MGEAAETLANLVSRTTVSIVPIHERVALPVRRLFVSLKRIGELPVGHELVRRQRGLGGIVGDISPSIMLAPVFHHRRRDA